MKLSDMEKKLLMLALDKSATDDEVAAAAKKFIRSLRERFPSGVELIKSLETGFGDPLPDDIVFATREAAQAAADAMNRGFGGTVWGDILREAAAMGRKMKAQQAAQQAAYGAQQTAFQQQQRAQQESWTEYLRRQMKKDKK
jgi:hypothetical protein